MVARDCAARNGHRAIDAPDTAAVGVGRFDTITANRAIGERYRATAGEDTATERCEPCRSVVADRATGECEGAVGVELDAGARLVVAIASSLTAGDRHADEIKVASRAAEVQHARLLLGVDDDVHRKRRGVDRERLGDFQLGAGQENRLSVECSGERNRVGTCKTIRDQNCLAERQLTCQEIVVDDVACRVDDDGPARDAGELKLVGPHVSLAEANPGKARSTLVVSAGVDRIARIDRGATKPQGLSWRRAAIVSQGTQHRVDVNQVTGASGNIEKLTS
ncbi:hypothetical protein Pla108_42170 [Botrimarina colliarenosi]|uniref:Uncharacterized protein n=1 Tax=Botrimarina colliarenosi TaxID=2528001 RepID=A0A5C5ZX27_9BACT|nr:hypothetical protein Pla108_42170 [Botrimarina colliarenosi]